MNSTSLDGASTAVAAFDDIDAGWDDVPESASNPLRHPVSGIVLPKSLVLSAKSSTGEVDEPTLEISEVFADDVGLDFTDDDYAGRQRG